MATKLTQSTYYHVLGSSSVEKRLDSAPDGTLWALLPENQTAKMYASTDGGITWKYAPNSDFALGYSGPSSLFIDVDGFAHVAWMKPAGSSLSLNYARGVPVAGNGWAWTQTSILTTAALVTSPPCEVIAFPHGTGWVAFVAYSGGTVARFTISYNGTVTDVNRFYLYEASGATSTVCSIDFNHVGDGKTPRADPHIYVAEAHGSSSLAFNMVKHPYANGAWSVGTPLSSILTTPVPRGTLTSLWDGDRFYLIYLVGASDRTDARTFWTDFGVTQAGMVAFDPPALPSVEIQEFGQGVAVAHDIVTDDLYLAVQGGWSTNSGYLSDVFLSKLDRTAGTWSSWSKAVDLSQVQVPSNMQSGKIQMQRHPGANVVHLLYGSYVPQTSYSGTWAVNHATVAEMPRTPVAPTLSSPANGATLDLEAGANFDWVYNRSGPSDAQQAYVFRRNTDGVLTYWNALSQGWQSTEVWNASTSPSASMPPAAWVNGRAYNWTVRVRSAYGFDSPYASERTVVASEQPAVNITSPAGSVLTESTPLIEWTYASSDPQASYEARVFKSASVINIDTDEPVWASGVIASATARSVRVGLSLEDGLAYVTYLRATSKTGLASTWDGQPFSMAVAAPTGPLVEVSESRSYPEGVPNVRLNLMTRSNAAGRDQAVGVEGWEIDSDAPSTVSTGKTWDPVQAWSPAEAWGGGGSGGGDAALAFQLTSESGREPGMVLTAQSAGNIAIRNVTGSTEDADFPALGGVTYTGLAHVQAAAVERSAVAKIRWFDNADSGKTRTNLLAHSSLNADDNLDGIANGWTDYLSGAYGTPGWSLGSGIQTLTSSSLGTTYADRVGVQTSVTLQGDTTYTLSADAFATNLPQGRRITLWIDLIDAENTHLSRGAASLTESGRMAFTITTPPTTVRGVVYVFLDGWGDPPGLFAEPTEASFTKPLIEQSATDDGYFDGSYVSDSRYTYAWVGTPHASASTAVDALDGLISESVGPVVFTSTTEAKKVTVTAEAPARTLRSAFVVEVRELALGEQHYVSKLSFHPDVDTEWQPGGAVGQQSLRVDRSDDDGKTWKRIRDVVPVDRYQRAVVYDGSFVFGRRQRYRAYTDRQVNNGAVLSSGTSSPAAITVNTDSWVLRDPRTPDVEMLAMVIGHRRSDKAKHSVQQPINARYPIVDIEGNTSATGQLTIYVPARQRATMTEILRRGVPIQVQSPIGEKWLAQFVARDYESMVGAQRTITVDYVEII